MLSGVLHRIIFINEGSRRILQFVRYACQCIESICNQSGTNLYFASGFCLSNDANLRTIRVLPVWADS